MNARAFTLLELVIGTTMSLAIAGVAMGTLLTVQTTQVESQLKNAATRDAMYMLDMVGGDVGFAGVGVPWGVEANGLALRMRPVVRVATDRTIAFIGDLPLPNSDLNGLAVLSDLGGAFNSQVAVTSELALCAPDGDGAGPYACNTARNSLFDFPDTEDCSSDLSARTCPWALGKWAAIDTAAGADGQLLLFTAPDGTWAWRRVEAGSSGFPKTADLGTTIGIDLQLDFPITNGHPLSPARFLRPAVGATVVATLDRVFYSVETLDFAPCTVDDRKCVLRRRHCWGEVLNADSPGFPAAGAAALTSATTPAGCAAPREGTKWETVANNLDSFTFRYFDRFDVELAAPLSTSDLERVASIDIDLVIARVVPATQRIVSHRVERRFFLEAGDGFGPIGRR